MPSRFARRDTDWHTVTDESEAFYLRIAATGQYRYPGADLGILVTRGRFMDDEHELLDRARIVDHRHQGPVRERAPRRGHAATRQARAVRLQDALSSGKHLSRCWPSRPVSLRPSPNMRMLPFTFRALEELEIGPKWQAVFEEKWPHYRAWFLREGEAARPSYATSVRMLRAHMPELMPAYERFVDLAGGGDLAARMLSLYRPPPYLAACSQGAWTRDGHPARAELRLRAVAVRGARSGHTRLLEKRVIGMSDCLWGLLDGMNDDGLAVSLTFGGRRVLGDGFGIPIVLRYLLETCTTVDEARAALARLPYSLSHNLTVVDAEGRVPDGVPLAGPRADLPDLPGGHEPPGHRGVAGAGPRHAHDRARAGGRAAPRRSSMDDGRRSPMRSCARRCSRPPTRTGSARCTPPRTTSTDGVAEIRWPTDAWRESFETFTEAEHTEVLAEPAFTDVDLELIA